MINTAAVGIFNKKHSKTKRFERDVADEINQLPNFLLGFYT